MQWTIAEARQRFSELVKAAADEPQVITNRSRPVAAIVDGEMFRQFQEWSQGRQRTLFASFEELKKICAEENYELEIPPRTDRVNPFPGLLDELPG